MTLIGSVHPKLVRGGTPAAAALVVYITALAPLAGADCGSSVVPVARIQEASATTSAGATSLSLAWPAPTTAGNFLALAVHVLWNSTVGDIGVPPGWTLAERADNVGFDDVTVALYYREHAPSQSGIVPGTAL